MCPLEDKETTAFTHLDMVILSIEEEVEEEVEEVEEEEIGFRKGKWKDLMEDLVEDIIEITMQEHNNKLLQIDLNQLDRKMSGLYPLMLREEMIQRDNRQHKRLPQLSLLLQRKDYIDWSSEGSPRERLSQQIQSARSVESRRTMNQTEQSVRELEDDEVI